MLPLEKYLPRVTLDFAWVGVAGGAVATVFKGEPVGESFCIGALWLGLNTMLLGLLISALSGRRRRAGLAVALLACAKIPLAYFLLLWLLSRDFIAPSGIIAALAALPIVMVGRGLAGRQGTAT
jgi:hypothetical protein